MADTPKVAGVLLAAGTASRMGGASKVLASFDGEPLVRRQAIRLLASKCDEVLVVTGHDGARVAQAVTDLPVRLVHNTIYANGMGTSIAAAAATLDDTAMLLTFADMPALGAAHFDTVIDSWTGIGIVRGADGTKPGHPILFPSEHLCVLRGLKGDVGAKQLVADATLVDIGCAATLDVDTPDAVRQAGGEPG
ncbi:MAG: nucleotidyltransferase family protein [Pseudomonadota bacterium]